MLTQCYELTDIPVQLPANVTPLTLSEGNQHYKWSSFCLQQQSGHYIFHHLRFFSPAAPYFPSFQSISSAANGLLQTNFYSGNRIRNKANKICKICSPKQHLLVSVCRLIESLCAVISVECSLTNILTYLVQLVLH